MYERRHQKLAPLSVFIRRVLIHILWALLLVAGALGLGVLGYHFIARLSWVDSLYEASMILGGMGPFSPLRSNAAKIFASGYALFSGLVFIALMGIVLAPVVHRMLHKFHLDERDL
ncbi:MAG: hypothetical protein NUW07_08195 [Candidatus Saccharicenans sp.]|jgi:hypothetical protein|nr:hypothetical protein [Candidatus Saccharicenans sp.]MDH7494110.1 hypothetical protein [Candidatus Saccharicenans sp.]